MKEEEERWKMLTRTEQIPVSILRGDGEEKVGKKKNEKEVDKDEEVEEEKKKLPSKRIAS